MDGKGIEVVSRTNLDLSKKGQEKEEKAQMKAAKEKEDKKALISANKQLMKELEKLKKKAAEIETPDSAQPKHKRVYKKKSVDALPTASEDVNVNLSRLLCSVEECEEFAEETITAACKHYFCSMHGPSCSNHIGHVLTNRVNPCYEENQVDDLTTTITQPLSHISLPSGIINTTASECEETTTSCSDAMVVSTSQIESPLAIVTAKTDSSTLPQPCNKKRPARKSMNDAKKEPRLHYGNKFSFNFFLICNIFDFFNIFYFVCSSA